MFADILTAMFTTRKRANHSSVTANIKSEGSSAARPFHATHPTLSASDVKNGPRSQHRLFCCSQITQFGVRSSRCSFHGEERMAYY